MQELKDAPFGSDAADELYQKIFTVWSNGDQQKAEQMLTDASVQYQGEMRLALFAAACVRSRFNIKKALPIFQWIAKNAPLSRQKRAAEYMVALDTQKEIDKNFNGLAHLAMDLSPHDPIILWLFGIACRTYSQSKLGIIAYTDLMKQVTVGSSLVHQTFANHLDDEKRYAESLPHRRMVIKLEPTGWSYDSLANLLSRLGKKEEAEKIRKEGSVSSSRYSPFWIHWCKELIHLKRYTEAIVKIDKALALNAKDADATNARGWALQEMGKLEESLLYYRKSIAIDPNPIVIANAVEVLNLLGRKKEAKDLQARFKNIAKR
jgi:tetratricopeptide (TPR) repeat protein